MRSYIPSDLPTPSGPLLSGETVVRPGDYCYLATVKPPRQGFSTILNTLHWMNGVGLITVLSRSKTEESNSHFTKNIAFPITCFSENNFLPQFSYFQTLFLQILSFKFSIPNLSMENGIPQLTRNFSPTSSYICGLCFLLYSMPIGSGFPFHFQKLTLYLLLHFTLNIILKCTRRLLIPNDQYYCICSADGFHYYKHSGA